MHSLQLPRELEYELRSIGIPVNMTEADMAQGRNTILENRDKLSEIADRRRTRSVRVGRRAVTFKLWKSGTSL